MRLHGPDNPGGGAAVGILERDASNPSALRARRMSFGEQPTPPLAKTEKYPARPYFACPYSISIWSAPTEPSNHTIGRVEYLMQED
jgi:hypothetical protein